MFNTNTGNASFGGLTTPYNTAIAGTSINTFMVGVGDTGAGNRVFHYSDTGTAVSTAISMGGTTLAGGMMAACGSTGSSTGTSQVAASFAFPNSSGNAIVARVVAVTTVMTSTNVSTSFSASNIALASINNGGCVLVYRNGTTDLRYATFNAAPVQQSTGALVTGNTADVSIGASGIAGGTFAFAYGAVTTGFSTFGSAYSATYTNGVTTITSLISYTPAGGYYVLGIALTTAAAGTTGAVAINGPANLGASYPVLTSNILFDYTGTAFTARSAINANRGNVIGTNVTLRGLE